MNRFGNKSIVKRLLTAILKNDSVSTSAKLLGGFANGVNRFFRRINSVKVLSASVEFNQPATERDYYEEFFDFLMGYTQVEDTELVLLVDEFPQAIENMSALMYDGYIHYISSLEQYQFTSPVVKRWWIKFIC